MRHRGPGARWQPAARAPRPATARCPPTVQVAPCPVQRRLARHQGRSPASAWATLACTAGSSRAASTTRKRRGSRTRQFQVGRAHPLEEGRLLLLEAIGLAAARLRPRHAGRHRQIQQQRQVRLQLAHAPPAPATSIVAAVQAAAAALIGAGGIGETIADHPLAARQRRADQVRQVQAAGREHQQHFGIRRESPRRQASVPAHAPAPPAACRRVRASAPPPGRAPAATRGCSARRSTCRHPRCPPG